MFNMPTATSPNPFTDEEVTSSLPNNLDDFSDQATEDAATDEDIYSMAETEAPPSPTKKSKSSKHKKKAKDAVELCDGSRVATSKALVGQ